MSIYVQPPRPVFFDSAGSPLENGYIWIGAANLPPQTNPVAVFWDSALTQPAAQPIRTVNGYPSNAGTPSAIYTAAACSILVQNKHGSLVYSAPEFAVGVIGNGDIVTSMLANGAATLAKLDRTGLVGQVLTGQGTGVSPVWTAGLNTTRIDVASAATINLTTSAPNTRNINITGTTDITSFLVVAGSVYFVRFAGALTLTNGANLVTQTGSNISTQPGDTCILRATADNVVEVLSYAKIAQPFLGPAVLTTSGTAIDFTGIPSWVRRVTVIFNGVSTNGTSLPVIRLGTSGGIQTTSYSSSSSSIGSTVNTAYDSTGFIINSGGATDALCGAMTIQTLGFNIWVASANIHLLGNAITWCCAGICTLSGTLDRLRLTTLGGTSTFDAGTVTVLWGEA